ncbi:MAG: hypothetical protein IKK89_07950 [Alistipes sp.]|nr:hypothetical protein [Alistipes sp.]MBR6813657.1 hypothetical protein [Tidjanibacter sp.]
MLNKIEKFLEQFPTDATSWVQATDEVRDLARTSREMLDEYDDIKVEAVDFTAARTPAEWNTKAREAILRNYDLMRPRTQTLFFERFEDWFNA